MIPMHLKAQRVSVDTGPAGCGSDLKGAMHPAIGSVCVCVGMHGPVMSLPTSRCMMHSCDPNPLLSAYAQAESAFAPFFSGCVSWGLCF